MSRVKLPDFLLAALIITLLLVDFSTFFPTSLTHAQNIEPTLTTDLSGPPLLRALNEVINELERREEPHPEIIEYTSNANTTTICNPRIATFCDLVTQVLVNGKMVLEYSGPEDANKASWDDFIVGETEFDRALGTVDRNNVRVGDYNDIVINEYPRLFVDGPYELGTEPRMYNITDRLVITYHNVIDDSFDGIARFLIPSAYAESDPQKVLMGFTVDPPDIDWDINVDQTTCLPDGSYCPIIFSSRVGFNFEAAFALRLPAEVMVDDEPMQLGNSYGRKTTIMPLNLDRQQYEELGVPGLEGKELTARLDLFAGAIISTISDINVVDFSIVNINFDVTKECTESFPSDTVWRDFLIEHGIPVAEHDGLNIDCGDFITPFGTDENGLQRFFPLPSLKFSADQTGLEYSWNGAEVGLGLAIAPEFGSNRIEGNWIAEGDSRSLAEQSKVKYTSNNPSPALDLAAIDTTQNGVNDPAVVEIEDFRFYITELTIGLNARVELGGWLSLIPFELPYVELLKFDLSDIIDGELYLWQHAGTDAVRMEIPTVHGPMPFGAFLSIVPSEDYTIGTNVPTTFKVEIVDSAGRSLPNAQYKFEILKDEIPIVSNNYVGGHEYQHTFEDVGSLQVRLTDLGTNNEIRKIELEVIPEFPSGPAAALAALLGAIFIMIRMRFFRTDTWR